MFLRITTEELKECGYVGKNIAESLYRFVDYYGMTWPYYGPQVNSLVSSHYIKELMYKAGDKRKKGGKFGQRDYQKLKFELSF